MYLDSVTVPQQMSRETIDSVGEVTHKGAPAVVSITLTIYQHIQVNRIETCDIFQKINTTIPYTRHSFLLSFPTNNEVKTSRPPPQSLFDIHDHRPPYLQPTINKRHPLRLLHNLRSGPRLLYQLPLLGLSQHPSPKCHPTTGPSAPRTRHHAPPIQHPLHQRLAPPNLDQNGKHGAPPHRQRRKKRIHRPQP